ncbi:MAG TPA: plastocyanin/azurin family copper-binding protein [Chloroflexia bacterium]|nr:plastocyanin/azurin family copper-binding protein [Chloroflexia bacterium]
MLKKRRFLVTIVALLLLVPMLSACGEPQVPASTPVTNTGATPGAASEVTVSMKDNKYEPAEITVAAGSTVKWTNTEARKHTVTADDNAYKSGDMAKDAVFSRKFDTPGTFGYYCEFHGSPGSGMAGKIIVTAGGGGEPTPAVADNTPTQPAADTPTVLVVAPTATVEVAQATATAEPAKAAGSVRFKDDAQKTDQAIIAIGSLPERPAGKAQYAWLVNGSTGASASLGRITPDASGGLKINFSTPGKENLLALYDAFKVTNEELEVTPAVPSSDMVLSGQLPPKALVHIRHLLVSFDATPNKIGLEVGLLAEVDKVNEHAKLMRDTQAAGNLAGVKLHAEHLVNIIEGAKGPNFGDLNKDGKSTNPGDGWGLLQNGDQLGYLQGSKDHAELAATTADATDDIKLHAGHVGITVDNVSGWVTSIRDKALEALKAGDTAASAPIVAEIVKLGNQALNGVDLSGEGQILPVPGSGGALTSYQHAQLMAAIPVGGGNAATPPTAVAPTQAPVAEASPTTAPQDGGGSGVTIDMLDFEFGKAPAVKVGTTITWVNKGNAPHTATADNNAFDSGTLRKDQSFSFTVKSAGELKYYCALHGGPDGQGMAAVISVQP